MITFTAKDGTEYTIKLEAIIGLVGRGSNSLDGTVYYRVILTGHLHIDISKETYWKLKEEFYKSSNVVSTVQTFQPVKEDS